MEVDEEAKERGPTKSGGLIQKIKDHIRRGNANSLPAPKPPQQLRDEYDVLLAALKEPGHMRRVIIESPFSASGGAGTVADNVRYARAACMDAVMRQEIPFASHIFFTQFLDDKNPKHRELGIQMGFDFWQKAELVLFYVDLGMSEGMKNALAKCVMEDKPFEKRRLADRARIEANMQRLDASTARVPEPETAPHQTYPVADEHTTTLPPRPGPVSADKIDLDAIEAFARGMQKQN